MTGDDCPAQTEHPGRTRRRGRRRATRKGCYAPADRKHGEEFGNKHNCTPRRSPRDRPSRGNCRSSRANGAINDVLVIVCLQNGMGVNRGRGCVVLENSTLRGAQRPARGWLALAVRAQRTCDYGTTAGRAEGSPVLTHSGCPQPLLLNEPLAPPADFRS